MPAISPEQQREIAAEMPDDMATEPGAVTTESAADREAAEPETDSGVGTDATPAPSEAPSAGQDAQAGGGLRDYLRLAGVPVDAADDRAALDQLVDIARQNQEAARYAQIGRQVAPQATQILDYLRQQQTPKQEKPTTSPWDKPEFDQRWTGLVDFDEKSGLYVGKPGVQQTIVDGVNQYANWYSKVQQDPAGYQEHLFDTRFMPRVNEAVQAQRDQIERDFQVRQIVEQNSEWLYARDPQGRMLPGRDGRPQLSPAGSRYAQVVQEYTRAGVSDHRTLDYLARRTVSLELAAAQGGRQEQQAVAQTPQTQQATARPQRNKAGTAPAQERQAEGTPEPVTTGRSLAQSLREALKEYGDDDFGPPDE